MNSSFTEISPAKTQPVVADWNGDFDSSIVVYFLDSPYRPDCRLLMAAHDKCYIFVNPTPVFRIIHKKYDH